MVYITGDCHADFRKFNTTAFPDQKQMTKNDFVIVCGDFGGVWKDSPRERYWLSWLNDKPFTTVFVDGNHENFDRLNTEFDEIDFHGGRAHRIRDNVYHLMRGYVFGFDGKSFFCFGGAKSHDIDDGVLDMDDPNFANDYRRLSKDPMSRFRINHVSWWSEEMPSADEYERGRKSLRDRGWKVDYIITHCAPAYVTRDILGGRIDVDDCTSFLNEIADRAGFKQWFCGHYHVNKWDNSLNKIVVLYDRIERIV